MNIDEMNGEYRLHLDRKAKSSNGMPRNLHRMHMKEEEIAKVFSSQEYIEMAKGIERSFCDICFIDQIAYEKELKGD